MSLPSREMLPEEIGITPEMQLTSVVLPDPFGPIRPRISPAARVRSTPASAATPPNRLTTPRTESLPDATSDPVALGRSADSLSERALSDITTLALGGASLAPSAKDQTDVEGAGSI